MSTKSRELRVQLEELNRLDAALATREFLRCCGSTAWARSMAAARPFSSAGQMAETADAIWARLQPADWLEAFAAHPRIGPQGPGESGRPVGSGRSSGSGSPGGSGGTGGSPGDWSEQEQSGARSASDDERERLAAGNREYEERFGYIFIVCAAGKSAGEMLAALERRLRNDRVEELRVAAGEQQKITRLRLARLLHE